MKHQDIKIRNCNNLKSNFIYLQYSGYRVKCAVGSRAFIGVCTATYINFKIMGTLKGKAAIRLFKSYPELKKQPYRGNHFWARGYLT